MNVAEMVNELSLRLVDASSVNFTDTLKVRALNNAQNEVARRVRKQYLTELQVLETGKTATSGEYALSSLSYDVFGGAQGIIAVKINDGDWCTDITQKDLKKVENIFLTGSINNPLYYVYQNKIYVSNGQTSPSIDIYYLKSPADMGYKYDASALASPAATGFLGDANQNLSTADDTYNGALIYSVNQDSYHVVTDYVGTTRTFTVSPAADSNFGDDEIYFVTMPWDDLDIAPATSDADMHIETCELNEALHNPIVDIAEAECWSVDANRAQYEAAMARAKVYIDTLNARYQEAAGIGTKGARRGTEA